MDASDLRVFESVVRHGSMKRAAEELNTVQSNVTARIRALEDELAVPLFQRHPRGVVVTAAGERLLPYVGRIQKLLADARAAASDDGAPHGPLRVGSLETTAALRLSPLLSRFVLENPRVHLHLSTGPTAQMVADVIAYKLDGAFVGGPINHPDLHQEEIFREELVLITPPQIKSPSELAQLEAPRLLVFRSGCSYRQRLENWFAGTGIVIAAPLEFGSLDAIIACVGAGAGVSMLPRGVVANAAAEGRIALHELPEAHAHAPILFVRRHDAYSSSAMQTFLKLARGNEERASFS